MTKTQNPTTAHDAAVLLTLNSRFQVARVSGDRIYLATPASALNAADELRIAGVDASAVSRGQWHVRVY